MYQQPLHNVRKHLVRLAADPGGLRARPLRDDPSHTWGSSRPTAPTHNFGSSQPNKHPHCQATLWVSSENCPGFRGGDSPEWKVSWVKEEKAELLLTSQLFFMNDLYFWRSIVSRWLSSSEEKVSFLSNQASYPRLLDELRKKPH